MSGWSPFHEKATIFPSGETAGPPSNPPLFVRGLMIVGASGRTGFQFHVTQATPADTRARPANGHA